MGAPPPPAGRVVDRLLWLLLLLLMAVVVECPSRRPDPERRESGASDAEAFWVPNWVADSLGGLNRPASKVLLL